MKCILPAFAVMLYGTGKVYGDVTCAKPCDVANPCGDGKAQQSVCASPNITNWDTFGLDGETSFVGCSAAICETQCATMNATLDMDNQNGTYCFNKDKNMYSDKDLAEVSAISRGCGGSHFMSGAQLHMVGSSHPACDGTYTEEGVAFSVTSSAGSKVAFTAIYLAASAVALSVLN